VSGRIVKEVLECAPGSLSRLELLVLVSLAESAVEATRTTRHGSAAVAVIAHRCRTSEPSIRNTLGRLTSRGLIKPVHQRTRPGLAQQYTIEHLSDYHRTL
jgi:hypothetical protein